MFKSFSIMSSMMAMARLFRLAPPMPTGHSYRGRRGPASAPGKGLRVTPNNTGWWRRHALIQPMVITERMLLRHGWYRRKLRTEGIPIGTKNAMVLK